MEIAPSMKLADWAAYLHFSAQRRPQLRENNPEAGFGLLTKMLAAEWTGMSEAEKAPYKEIEKKDLERYERERGPRKPCSVCGFMECSVTCMSHEDGPK